jgi:hypothetical protein
MVTDNTTNVSHADAAQALVQKIQEIRDLIPNVVILTAQERRKLSGASSLSREFVEETVASTQNSTHLAVAGTLDATQMRDLLAFTDAYAPVVAQAESLMRFLQHTVAVAKARSGSQALMTYSLAQRLAKKPETAYLVPMVDAMRQKLGKRGASRKPQPQPQPAPAPTTHQ